MDNQTQNRDMDWGKGGEGEGQQSPGRNPTDDRSSGQQTSERDNPRIGEDEDSNMGRSGDRM